MENDKINNPNNESENNIENNSENTMGNNTENQNVDNTNVSAEAGTAPNNTENKTEEVDALAKATEEIKDLEDRFKRMLAEFENYKKRTQKEKENIYGMVTGDVLTTMLPIMDNLEKAAEAKTEDTQYQDGVKLVSRQFAEALKSLGLEEIESVGKRFDPQYHEAVSHIEDETKGEQEIVQEYRKGYKIGNKVVRYSMVIVAN
ncbi:MAG: nucleotide exchange factor GrpE [Clostridia bacterium]|nr:nucleotide exchange factor GrpE [Clostridia bacterium]